MKELYIILFLFSVLNLSGEILTLKDTKGNTGGDIRIDFEISELVMENDMQYSFTALSVYNDQPIGFRFEIEDKWNAECFADDAPGSCQNNVKIKSIGEGTDNLRAILNDFYSDNVFYSDSTYPTGLFNASSKAKNFKPNFLCIFEFLSPKLPLNNDHEIISGSCYRMIAVMDIPMKRVSVYYTLDPSCTTPALNVREDWLHATTKEPVEERASCCPAK